MSARRDTYAEVGAAIRQALARAAEQGITHSERKALDAVIATVSTYSRLSDRIPVGRVEGQLSIQEAGGLPDAGKAGEYLKSLARKKIINYAPTRGRGKVSLVGLPLDGVDGHYYPPGEKYPSGREFPEVEKSPSTDLKVSVPPQKSPRLGGDLPRSLPRSLPSNVVDARAREPLEEELDQLLARLPDPPTPPQLEEIKSAWTEERGREGVSALVDEALRLKRIGKIESPTGFVISRIRDGAHRSRKYAPPPPEPEREPPHERPPCEFCGELFGVHEHWCPRDWRTALPSWYRDKCRAARSAFVQGHLTEQEEQELLGKLWLPIALQEAREEIEA